MRFSYEAAFGKSSANGYERLLLDAMLGDATLFSHRDGVEAAWAQPFLSPPPRPSGPWLPWRMARIAYGLSAEAQLHHYVLIRNIQGGWRKPYTAGAREAYAFEPFRWPQRYGPMYANTLHSSQRGDHCES